MEFSQTSCTLDHHSNGTGTETHRSRIHDGNGVFIDVDFQHGIDDDLLVIAGDNLFTGDLSGFGARCRETQTPVLGVYDVGSLEEATKYGVVAVNDTGQISSFEEKPAQPQSTLIGIALYYLSLIHI